MKKKKKKNQGACTPGTAEPRTSLLAKPADDNSPTARVLAVHTNRMTSWSPGAAGVDHDIKKKMSSVRG
jgi:hypothetical protein